MAVGSPTGTAFVVRHFGHGEKSFWAAALAMVAPFNSSRYDTPVDRTFRSYPEWREKSIRAVWPVPKPAVAEFPLAGSTAVSIHVHLDRFHGTLSRPLLDPMMARRGVVVFVPPKFHRRVFRADRHAQRRFNDRRAAQLPDIRKELRYRTLRKCFNLPRWAPGPGSSPSY